MIYFNRSSCALMLIDTINFSSDIIRFLLEAKLSQNAKQLCNVLFVNLQILRKDMAKENSIVWPLGIYLR